MDSLSLFKRIVQRGLQPMLHEHNLSVQQWQTLMHLASRPEGMTTSELADELHVTSGAVSQFIDQLTDKGLVDRAVDAADRRVVRHILRASVKAEFMAIKSRHQQAFQEMFNSLSDEQIHSLSELLQQVATAETDKTKE